MILTDTLEITKEIVNASPLNLTLILLISLVCLIGFFLWKFKGKISIFSRQSNVTLRTASKHIDSMEVVLNMKDSFLADKIRDKIEREMLGLFRVVREIEVSPKLLRINHSKTTKFNAEGIQVHSGLLENVCKNNGFSYRLDLSKRLDAEDNSKSFEKLFSDMHEQGFSTGHVEVKIV